MMNFDRYNNKKPAKHFVVQRHIYNTILRAMGGKYLHIDMNVKG